MLSHFPSPFFPPCTPQASQGCAFGVTNVDLVCHSHALICGLLVYSQQILLVKAVDVTFY